MLLAACQGEQSEPDELPVMFTSDHIGELQPENWIETVIGSGTYGSVCKATWRGTSVAVKVIKEPG